MKEGTKGYFINVAKKEIAEVQIDQFADISKLLDCRTVERTYSIINGDNIYIDEEGLFVENPEGAFTYTGAGQVFSGHGFMLGSGLSPNTTLEQLRSIIHFVQVDQIPEATCIFIPFD